MRGWLDKIEWYGEWKRRSESRRNEGADTSVGGVTSCYREVDREGSGGEGCNVQKV